MSLRLRKLLRAAALLGLTLLAAMCEDNNTPTGSALRPDRLKYISGNNQTGRRLAQLGQPFTVQVLDTDGQPVPSYHVRFDITSLSGTFAGSGERALEVVTNSSGITSTYLVLGTSSDSVYTVTASAFSLAGSPLQGSPVLFSATVSGTAPASGSTSPGDTNAVAGFITVVTSPEQDTVGYTDRALATPRIVKVSDTFGSPIKNVPVYWSVLEGGGKVANNLSLTDRNGLAFGVWTLGPRPGLNRLQAYFIGTDGAINRVIFTVQALQNPDVKGLPYTMTGVDLGADTTGSVGRLFPTPLTVRVADSLGHGLNGIPVFYSAFQGGGAFDIDTKTTDENGVAGNLVRLGNDPGLNIVQATANLPNGQAAKVIWRIWAHRDPDVRQNAWDIARVRSENEPDTLVGAAGVLFPLPLVVAVTDTFGRGSPGQTVTFTVETGGGQLFNNIVTTSSEGIAQASFTLGPGAGLNQVRATIVRQTGEVRSVIFNLRGVTGAGSLADSIAIVSGNSQTGEAGTLLPLPLVVKVFDESGQPLAGAAVTFTVVQGSGFIGQEAADAQAGQLTLTTDGAGLAVITLRLGAGPDLDNRVVAEVRRPDGKVLSVRFGAQALPVPDSANRIVMMTGNLQGENGEYVEGTFLPLPLVVRVVDTTKLGVKGDTLGAPIPNFPVLFTSFVRKQGEPITSYPGLGGSSDGSPSDAGRLNVTTNVDGLAAVRLELAEGVGQGGALSTYLHNHRVVASLVFADGTQDSVIFFATAVPAPRADSSAPAVAATDSIAVLYGNGQTGVPGQLLSQPIILAVYDTQGDEVAGSQVTILLRSGGGSIGTWGQNPGAQELFTAVTDNQGQIRLSWRLGPGPVLDNEALALVTRSDGSVASVLLTAQARSLAQGPDSLAIISGDGQLAEVNQLLPLPVVVAVYDGAGNLVPGADVTFTISRGAGKIGLEGEDPGKSFLTVKTNASGLAVITWRLGLGPDLDNDIVAQIRLTDGTVRKVSLHVEALPSPDTANRLVVLSGDNQGYNGEYAVTAELPLPLVVRVVDTNRVGVGGDTLGAPISNFPVLFEAFSPSGDGAVDAAKGNGPDGTGRLESLTDEDGLAAVRLTLGTRTGAPDEISALRNNNSVIAVVVFADGTQDSVIFHATAVPAAANNISAVGGTELGGIAGKSLSELSVYVTDKYTNPVVGVGVSFSIDKSPGGGQINSPIQITDIYGSAGTAIDKLSTTAGDMSVSASSGSLQGSPIKYTITVSPDVPAQLLKAGGDSQVHEVESAFTNPVKVLIIDQYFNGVPNSLVTFTVTSGSASLSESAVFTDSDGYAETSVTAWATGAVAVRASATIGGAAATQTFNLTGVAIP